MVAVSSEAILRYPVVGARRLSNFAFAVIVAIGAIGFLLAGLSSFFGVNLLPISQPIALKFVPQGLALSFYGVAGTLLDVYLWLVIALDYGGGFNEFNRSTGKATVFRRGWLGKNRSLKFEYPLSDIQAVRVDIRNGFNPKRALYLRIKGKADLPITEVGQPMALFQLEDRAAEIARFLAIPLEGL
ncbi:MAG: photosystem I assembly protein Ycf4 [Oscillatoriales cyanobacterium SM2_2_1]|nr:photosystem I assembly protein Ycf4 [Oscillatoriales cyanobacterium SM2_2_1]